MNKKVPFFCLGAPKKKKIVSKNCSMANNMKSTIRAICSFGPELFGSEKKKSQPKLRKETRKAPIKKETVKKVAPPIPPRKKVLKLQQPQTAELKENVNDKDLLQKGQLLAAAGIFYSNVFIQFPSSFSLLFFFQLWQFYPKKSCGLARVNKYRTKFGSQSRKQS